MKAETPSFSLQAFLWKWFSNGMYGFCRAFLIGLFRVFYRVRVVGRENCPPQGGPLIIAANHIGEWDPPFLGGFVPWQAAFVAKVELFQALGGAMYFFFRALHCIPVNREKVEKGAIKECIQVARSSRPLVVFAEGGVRTNEHSILGPAPELKEGAVAMAMMADCPILPAVLTGTRAPYDWRNWVFFRRPMLELVIGKPYRLETRDRTAATADLLRRMLELKSQLKQQQIC
jgi:1-acyl-sn-glycerol-3-phosphate acyltransferase